MQQEALNINTHTHTTCIDICYLTSPHAARAFEMPLHLCDADLFAGTRDPRQTVTVSQSELDFDVDALRSFPADVPRSQPVVLVGFHDVTHLVGPHWGIPLIHDTDLLPLRIRNRRRTEIICYNIFIKQFSF